MDTLETNLYILDLDPCKCAKSYADEDIAKTIGVLKRSFFGVEVSEVGFWINERGTNKQWSTLLSIALCEEYKYRWAKEHSDFAMFAMYMSKNTSLDRLFNFCRNKDASGAYIDSIVATMPERFYLQVPDRFKSSDTVSSYRNFYGSGELRDVNNYTRRPPPKWMPKNRVFHRRVASIEEAGDIDSWR